jgi:hypothetical protein
MGMSHRFSLLLNRLFQIGRPVVSERTSCFSAFLFCIGQRRHGQLAL